MGREARRPAVVAVIALTGIGLLASAAAGLPWRWAVPVLACGGTALASSVLRHGRGGTAVPVVGVLGLAAWAVVPGGHLKPLGTGRRRRDTGVHDRAGDATASPAGAAIRGEAMGAVAVAAGASALLALPAATAPWLLPLGLVASVLAFALAMAGTGGTGGKRRP